MTVLGGNPEAHNYLDYFNEIPLDQLFSPASVLERIQRMYVGNEELHRLAGMHSTHEESPLLSTPEFAILHAAYARLRLLKEEVEQGIRFPNGDLTHPMC